MTGDPDRNRWRRYLADFHDQRPAITERLLAGAAHPAGASPYRWLVEPLAGVAGPILDVACGSAPTRPLLAGARWVGLDSSAGELGQAAAAGRGPLVRADADALPVADGACGAVCAAMCLPVLIPLDAVLDEIGRVLAPGGVLAALVPARLDPMPGQLYRWLRIMRSLGVRRQPWPNPGARDGLPRLLRAAGWRVLANDRRTFTVPIATAEDAALLVAGLYLPDVDPARVDATVELVASWAGRGARVALPLRRVLATRPARGAGQVRAGAAGMSSSVPA